MNGGVPSSRRLTPISHCGQQRLGLDVGLERSSELVNRKTSSGRLSKKRRTRILCISLEGLDGEGVGREVQKGGDICISSVQFNSVAQSCPTLCDPMNHSMPGLPFQCQLPEFTQTHVHQSVMPSSHLILCCPLFLLPPIHPSIRVFSNELTLRIR